jgi:2-polyprenyl-3-methyl-5-hydroxy-6-metoxy-1,4-benzoquinol methylase
MMICKICNSKSDVLFSSKVLHKFVVKYYKCKDCGFVQTETPYWLDEAYSSAITAQDIGLVGRNSYYAPIISLIIKLFYFKKSRFLDYGGGYGIFVRLMRDRGFSFYRYDTYCENMFAVGFDDLGGSNYELITAFEVFEHLVDPMTEIENMLKKSNNIFFSTELQPINFSGEKDWWYVMPETGQHISLYTMDALQVIAKKHNLNLYSNGKTFHLLTKKNISPLLFKLAVNRYSVKIFNKLLAYPESLLMKDYQEVVNRNKEEV